MHDEDDVMAWRGALPKLGQICLSLVTKLPLTSKYSSLFRCCSAAVAIIRSSASLAACMVLATHLLASLYHCHCKRVLSLHQTIVNH